jgi:hypothetical protein
LHPLDGGQPRVLLADSADTGAGNLQTLTFTPDSQHVVSAGRVKGVRGVWLFDIAGGEPRRIDVPMDLVSTWRFNPKTWQVAITTTNAPQFEIRRIENFLGNVVSQRGAR